jgi:hypothetical protein
LHDLLISALSQSSRDALEGRTQILIYIVPSLGTTNLDKIDEDMPKLQAIQRGFPDEPKSARHFCRLSVNFAKSIPSIRIWLYLSLFISAMYPRPMQVTSLAGFHSSAAFPVAAPSLDDRARNGTILHNTANCTAFFIFAVGSPV